MVLKQSFKFLLTLVRELIFSKGNNIWPTFHEEITTEAIIFIIPNNKSTLDDKFGVYLQSMATPQRAYGIFLLHITSTRGAMTLTIDFLLCVII